MRALIIYASHRGPTEWIAQRMAAGFLQSGLPSDPHNILEPSAEPISAGAYQAIVIGSPRRHGLVDPRLSGWVAQHRWILAERPTALFFLELEETSQAGPPAAGSPAGDLEACLDPWVEQSFTTERDHRLPPRLPRHLLHRQWTNCLTQEEAASFSDEAAVELFSRRFVQQIQRSERPRWRRSTATLAPPTARASAYRRPAPTLPSVGVVGGRS